MIGEYSCNYLLRTGVVCGRTCRRPEGCFEHWKAKPRIPCKVCGKPTSSEPSLCRKHASGYYVTQYINRLRDKANADDLIRMKIDELLLELSANKTEEAGEQKHEFEKQLEEQILEGSHETLLKQEKNNIKYTNEIYDDFGLFD